MSAKVDKIQSWPTPQWHPDWGDAELEMRSLKEFSLQLVARDERFDVEINHIDVGYVRVEIFLQQRRCAELWYTDAYLLYHFDSDGQEEKEMHFADVNEGVQLLIATFPAIQ
ncbi:MAG: hypothetical protein SGJ20_21885 [Planctomycetota bacterium]|nr:hypothetical protein [Planctomycetota bacterium]